MKINFIFLSNWISRGVGKVGKQTKVNTCLDINKEDIFYFKLDKQKKWSNAFQKKIPKRKKNRYNVCSTFFGLRSRKPFEETYYVNLTCLLCHSRSESSIGDLKTSMIPTFCTSQTIWFPVIIKPNFQKSLVQCSE